MKDFPFIFPIWSKTFWRNCQKWQKDPPDNYYNLCTKLPWNNFAWSVSLPMQWQKRCFYISLSKDGSHLGFKLLNLSYDKFDLSDNLYSDYVLDWYVITFFISFISIALIKAPFFANVKKCTPSLWSTHNGNFFS